MTAVTFGDGTALLRCVTHETKRWTVDGVTVDSSEALRALRSLFTDRRGGQRRRSAAPAAAPARPKVISLERPSYDTTPASRGAGADAQLTALLHARGLQGTWAVA
jgi:hypothetical protein